MRNPHPAFPYLEVTLTCLVVTPEQLAGLGEVIAQFAAYAPDFKGPGTVENAVRQVRSVWEKASLENGDGGAFISHFGNKQWL